MRVGTFAVWFVLGVMAYLFLIGWLATHYSCDRCGKLLRPCRHKAKACRCGNIVYFK